MDKRASGAKAVKGKQPRATPHLLDLRGWYVSGTKRLKKHIQLTIEMIDPVFPHCCAQTGELRAADKPRKFGLRTIGIRDLPLHGEAIDLKAIRPRLQCRQCKKVVAAHTGLGRSQKTDPTDRGLGPDIDPRHRMTTRLVRYIQAEAATGTFSEVGQVIGVPEATVRAIFGESRGPSNDKMQLRHLAC